MNESPLTDMLLMVEKTKWDRIRYELGSSKHAHVCTSQVALKLSMAITWALA